MHAISIACDFDCVNGMADDIPQSLIGLKSFNPSSIPQSTRARTPPIVLSAWALLMVREEKASVSGDMA